jgi:heme oxygenase
MPGSERSDPLQDLRAMTRARHEALEAQPVFAALMSPALTLLDVQRAFQVFQAFYACAEPDLLPQLAPAGLGGLYRPRLSWLAADLLMLDIPALPAVSLDPMPSSRAGLLGVIYAIEGSALGGQVLQRHLRERLGEGGESFALRLSYFQRMAEGIGPHWQAVLNTARVEMNDASALHAAVDGVEWVFSSLIALADAARQDRC